MALEPQIITNLRAIIKPVYVNEYTRIAANLQYQRFTKILPSTTLKQTFVNLLENAVISDYGQDGGAVRFEDQVIGEQSYVNHVFKTGWKSSEFKFKDLDNSGIMGGEGIQLLTQWTKNTSARAAYQPQYLAIEALKNGISSYMTIDGKRHDLVCYDSKTLFAGDHPYNFKRTGLGTFCNQFVGVAGSGAGGATNVGFRPLAGPFKKHTTGEWIYDAGSNVSVEDAFNNLWEVITAISQVKMADGLTPRYLRPTSIIAGTKLQKNLLTLLNAQFIAAQSGSTGGGAMEIKGIITKLGMSEPVILPELSGQSALKDWDWYIECEENVQAADIGSINIGVNEPFSVKFFAASSGNTGINLELAISNEVAAVGQMRMFVGVGQPQFIYKSQAPAS